VEARARRRCRVSARIASNSDVDLPSIEEAKRPGIDVGALAGDGIALFTAAIDWAFEQANKARATAD
jgi:hypothetical protein